MTTYLVSIEEVVRYTVEVDAATKGEAEDIAMDTIINSDPITLLNFFTGVEEREVYFTMEKAS